MRINKNILRNKLMETMHFPMVNTSAESFFNNMLIAGLKAE